MSSVTGVPMSSDQVRREANEMYSVGSSTPALFKRSNRLPPMIADHVSIWRAYSFFFKRSSDRARLSCQKIWRYSEVSSLPCRHSLARSSLTNWGGGAWKFKNGPVRKAKLLFFLLNTFSFPKNCFRSVRILSLCSVSSVQVTGMFTKFLDFVLFCFFAKTKWNLY